VRALKFGLGLSVAVTFASMLLVAGSALADGGAQTVKKGGVIGGYSPSNAALYRTALDGGDAVDITDAANVALTKISCGGFQTVTVSGRFSGAAATSVIRVVRYTLADVAFDVSETTLTAKSATDGTLYFSNPVPFDTEGAAYVRVLHADPSAGTVALWAGVH